MGCCCFYGHGVDEDRDVANKWFKKSAEQGNAKAQFNLGLSYYKGEGIGKDYSKAMHWFAKAAEQGDADAQLHVGRCLQETNASNEEIVTAYRNAAEMRQPEAQCFLGDWCYHGEMGLPVDMNEANKWWRKAAEQGESYAQYKVGLGYDFGRGVDKDKKEAVKWYKRSASKGYVTAIYQLGSCYYHGNGIKKNKKEALKYFRIAAKYDFADAVCMIGDYYYYGDIVDEDEEEAIKYYKRAVELGSKMAESTLAILLQKSEIHRTDDVP